MRFLILSFFILGVFSAFASFDLLDNYSLLSKPEEVSPPIGAINEKEEIQKLKRLFDTQGSRKAYAYFKSAYERFDSSTPHILGHFIGAELYKREGMEGLNLCDESYDWGCYHGFLGVAFEGGGDFSLVKEADKACKGVGGGVGEYGACLHGLGHGITAFLGYKRDDLSEGLSNCDLLPSELARNSCYTGVFMEYNLKIMSRLEEGSDATLRSFDPENPLEPCVSLNLEYQQACYLELPSYLVHTSPDFGKVGGYCERISTPEFKETCYRGMARSTPSLVRYDKDQMARKCHQLSSEKGVAFCVDEVVKLLSIHGEDALSLCDSLNGGDREMCIKSNKGYRCDILKNCE